MNSMGRRPVGRTLRGGALLLVGMGLSACAPMRDAMTPPEEGGPEWREVVTAHIVLRTDLDADDAREAAQTYEALYSAIWQVGFPPEPQRQEPIQVVVFSRQKDYTPVAPRDTDGFFRRIQAFDGQVATTAVISGAPTPSNLAIFSHEITHSFVRFYYPQAHGGVNEGLAQFYQTVAIEEGSVVVGNPDEHLRFRPGMSWDTRSTMRGQVLFVPVDAVPALPVMLALPQKEFHTQPYENNDEHQREARRVSTNYAGAWGAVHFLMTGPEPYRKAFEAYLRSLGEATMEPEAAFARAFADVDQAALERDFRAALTPREWGLIRMPLSQIDTTITSERTLTPADVHTLWTMLWFGEARDLEEANLAVKADPGSVEARLWRARVLFAKGKAAEAEADLREAHRLRPSSVPVRYALLALESERTGRVVVDAPTLALLSHARSPNVLRGLSLLHGRIDPDKALSLAKKAVLADPSLSESYHVLAAAAAGKGLFAEAAKAERMALNLLPESASEASVEALEEQLREYEAKALAAAPPTPPATQP